MRLIFLLGLVLGAGGGRLLQQRGSVAWGHGSGGDDGAATRVWVCRPGLRSQMSSGRRTEGVAMLAHRLALLGMRGGEPWAGGLDSKPMEEESEPGESAAWIYKAALEKDPTDPQALSALGQILYDVENNVEEAETLFVSALQNYPLHRPSLYNMGMLMLYGRENYERATHFLGRAVEADPQHIPSIHTYARLLHVHVKDYAKAEEMYSRGLALNPQNGDLMTDYGNLLEIAKGEKQAAVGMYTMASSLSPANPIVQCHNARGMEMRGEIAGAEQEYKRILALHPDHVPTLCNLGLLLYARKIPREPTIARQLWERSLFIAPGHTDTLVNYATLLIENNQPRIAYDMLATALKVDPDKVEAMCSMGVLLESRAQQLFREQEYESIKPEIDAILARADGHYARALSLSPGHVDTMCNRAALLHCHRGGPGATQAEVLYRQVLETSPQHSGALYNLGFLKQQAGETRAAMELYERVYELEPHKPHIQRTLSTFTLSKYYDQLGFIRQDTGDDVDGRLKMHSEHWAEVKAAREAHGAQAEWVGDNDPVPYNRGAFGGDAFHDDSEDPNDGVW